MQAGALLKLLIPVVLVILAAIFRESLAQLSGEMLVIANSMPYVTGFAVVLMSHLFGRSRPLLAAISVMALYWLIRSDLQVTLSDPDAAATYLGVSLCLPLLSIYLIALPERGIWNPRGMISTASYVVLVFAVFMMSQWAQFLPETAVHYLQARPSESYVLSLGVTALVATVIIIGIIILCRRNGDIEAALLASTLALYLTLALLHLPFISLAMCTAANLALVYGLLRNSHAMAYKDDLTGLLGRRALNERLASLGRRYVVAMLDVDHFKKFNDKHGHDVGDQVLRLVASRIKNVRGGQSYRYGGEEFCIVFPRRGVPDCLEVLEELRTAISEYRMSLRDKGLRPVKRDQGTQKRGATRVSSAHVSVTVSIGVAEKSAELQNAEAVIKAADQNLYRAKRAGRDRVVA